MQNFKRLFFASLSLIALSFASCEMVSVDPSNPPTMELDIYDLNVTGEGGDIPVYYAVTNPVKGAMPEAKSNVDWITPINIDSYQIVAFQMWSIRGAMFP